MKLLQQIPDGRAYLKKASRLFFKKSFCRLKNLLCLLVIFSSPASIAQQRAGYKIFDRTPLSQLQIQLPQVANFRQIDFSNPMGMPTNPTPGPGVPVIGDYDHDIREQNQRVLQMHEAMRNGNRLELPDDVQQDMRELEMQTNYNVWMEQTKYFRKAFDDLQHLNPDSFSITRAVYIVENAWYENKYSYQDLQNRLTTEAKIIKQILKDEKLDGKKDMALNYAIQKRFKQGGSFYDPKAKTMRKASPFTYDFKDYMGKDDYRQMFVTKMLLSGKGQCHSLPLGYLMVAEQVGAKAWLAIAPQHYFVRFMDANGNLLNFETTSGSLVSNTWLTQSSYINAQALQNRTYLDTLSQRNLYAQMMADLLQGYLKKFNFDGFAYQMQQRILQINPDNITALIIDAELKRQLAMEEIHRAGVPPEKDLPNYPQAYHAYLAMQQAMDRVDDLGYQDMPPDAYQAWLKSVETEKQKQEQKAIQQRVQKEIQQMKMLPKSTLINKPKD
jgi:hypothetical protein